jgi:hypothetical protein
MIHCHNELCLEQELHNTRGCVKPEVFFSYFYLLVYGREHILATGTPMSIDIWIAAARYLSHVKPESW